VFEPAYRLTAVRLNGREAITNYFFKMAEGKIARLTDRGYGFIAREGVEKDLFFHANELKNAEFNDLKEGDPVTFDVEEGPKGPNATNVNRK
jgi:CspA family cold shock protein